MKVLLKLIEQLCDLIRVCQANPVGAAWVLLIACLILIPGSVVAAVYVVMHSQ